MIPIVTSKEKQALDYFINECKNLNKVKSHCGPREDDGCYDTVEFDKERANKLFIDLKHFWTVQNI